MTDTTPKDLSAELGVTAKSIREWLRAEGHTFPENKPWQLSEDQSRQVRKHFAKS